jgi:N-glycosylase/DNA lyase
LRQALHFLLVEYRAAGRGEDVWWKYGQFTAPCPAQRFIRRE